MRTPRTGAAAALLVLAACTSTPSDESTTDVDPVAGCPNGPDQVVVIGHDERPEDFHPFRTGPRITQWVNQGLFEGLWGVNEHHEFVPELLADDASFERHVDDSVTVTLRLRDGLTWSDGTALTSQHVEDTWRLIMERSGGGDGEFVLEFGSRTGYELIHPDSWEHGSGGSFSFLLTEPFGGLRNLFTIVLPTHVLDSASAANIALASGRVGIEALPASGPLSFGAFGDDGPLELVRNDAYHGSALPDAVNPGPACVGGVTIEFVADSADLAARLIDGSIDVVVAPAARALAEHLVARPDVTVASVNGLAIEHWGFNLNDPHLADPLVRRAIATAMDKQAVIDGVYAPIHGPAAPSPIGNFFLLPTQVGHQDHQAQLGRGDTAAAQELLRAADYQQVGERWSHPDRGVLELEVGTTPDPIRQAQFEILRRALEEAGIVLTLVEDDDWLEEVLFSEASLLCSREGESGVLSDLDEDGTAATSDCGLWDIAQFTWQLASPWPGSQIAQFVGGSIRNPYGVNDEAIDELARTCVDEMDLVASHDCFNRLDRQLLSPSGDPGVVMVPLTQRSTFVAWQTARLEVPATSDAAAAGLLARAHDIIPLVVSPSEALSPTPARSPADPQPDPSGSLSPSPSG